MTCKLIFPFIDLFHCFSTFWKKDCNMKFRHHHIHDQTRVHTVLQTVYFKDPIGLHYFDSVCFTKTCFLLQSTLIISIIHFDTNMSFPQLQRDGKYMTMLLRISTPAQSPIVVLYNCIEVKKQKQNPKTASLHNKTTLGHFKKLLKSTCTFLMRPCWNFNLSQK